MPAFTLWDTRMFRLIRGVLSAAELEHLRTLAARTRFVDGRATNPEGTVKHNLQAMQDEPTAAEPGVLVRNALFRHPDVRTFSFPRQMARPTLAKYQPGMTYGWHVDEAMFPSNPPLRSDLSCTVWISPPESYDGGELCVELGNKTLQFKEAAGDALLYPSTTVHQVAPVTRGERLVAITWLQSYIADPAKRELLLQIEEARAIEHAGARNPRVEVLLAAARSNLFRMWSDT